MGISPQPGIWIDPLEFLFVQDWPYEYADRRPEQSARGDRHDFDCGFTARMRDLEEERRRERVLRFGLPFALLRLRNLERRHAHLNPVPHHACFMKRNLRLDSAGTRADRWQEMSLRSFCRASFPALLADLLDPLSDLLDLCVGL